MMALFVFYAPIFCGIVLFDMFFAAGLGVPPWTDFWPPLGHSMSDVVDSLEDFGSNFAPKFKDSRATKCTNHTFNKTTKESNTLY